MTDRAHGEASQDEPLRSRITGKKREIGPVGGGAKQLRQGSSSERHGAFSVARKNLHDGGVAAEANLVSVAEVTTTVVANVLFVDVGPVG